MAMIDDSVPAVPIGVSILTAVACAKFSVQWMGIPAETLKTPVIAISIGIAGMITVIVVWLLLRRATGVIANLLWLVLVTLISVLVGGGFIWLVERFV